MSKKMVKLSIALIAMLLMVMTTMPVFATDKPEIETKVDKAMEIALNIASSIGIAVAVILLIVVAIKYMSAAPSDKAEIKKHMVVYVVGAVLLLCAAGVLQLIKSLGNSIIGEEDAKINTLMPTLTLK